MSRLVPDNIRSLVILESALENRLFLRPSSQPLGLSDVSSVSVFNTGRKSHQLLSHAQFFVNVAK